MKFIVKLGIFILSIVIGILVIGLYWTFYKPLPDYGAIIEIEGLNERVDVHWDPYGTPYIYANNELDLYKTVGYIHAQERLWQMTLSQMASEGRFAEYLGQEALPFDIHQRTIGFWEIAKQIEKESPPDLIRLLEAYSEGVNSYVKENKNSLPIEFSLLDVAPIRWTPTHSIALSRLMAWDQNIHWISEIAYAALGRVLDPIQLQQLIPVYSDQFPTTLSEGYIQKDVIEPAYSFLKTEKALRKTLQKEGSPFGSNAWAVNGNKTHSGKPILAGDPHMALSIPGVWFEMYLNTPNHQIAGASIPGSPFIVIGQNKYIAWSMTSIMADDTDFFLEAEVPGNTDYYISDSLSTPVSQKPFFKRNEVIKVKNGADVLHVVRSTERGPIISDTHPAENLVDNQLISLRWMGLNASQELWAIYNMNRAINMEEFRNAVREFKSPAMNFIYADNSDNIAIFSGASLPIRDFNPLTFRPGWNPSYNWNETIPFDELPHVVNPDQNYVAHANNKIHPSSYPHYIATFWEPPSRILRIEQVLQFSDSLTVEDMQALQYDSFSEHAREITEIILPVLRGANSEPIEEALPYLENWDYDYEPTSTAASIFDLFYMKLADRLLKEQIGADAYNALIELEHLPVMIVNRFLRDGSMFLLRSPENQSMQMDTAIRQSMEEAVEELRTELGPEPFEWRWENLLTLTLKPPLLGEAADEPDAPYILRLIVENLLNRGPFPGRGHGMSVNKGQYSWHQPFEMNLGASIRRIVDFSTPERTLTVLPTGQSGNPFSANYGDQSGLWVDGRYRYIYQDSTFFQQTSYQTMTFEPAD